MTFGGFLLEQAWHLVLLAGLLACSAFFSGSETALFALSRGQLYRLSQDPRPLARLPASLMRHPDRVLTTVLLGNNVVNILYFVFSTLLIVKAQGAVSGARLWAPVMAAATLLAIILFGEIVPKTTCFLWPARLAPLAAPPLAALGRVVRPIRAVLMAVIVGPLIRLLAPSGRHRGELTGEEMTALLALSQKRGLIGADKGELLQEVLELTDLTAGDIMVPRVDVVACDVDAPREALLAIVRRRRVTKVPVYEGDLDHVVGIVYAKRLLVTPDVPVRRLAAPVQFVPESAPLERVLVQLRAASSQMAVVVDEYGGTAGLVTLEDILEEVVGDIPDAEEPPEAPPVQQVHPAEWLVDGDLPIHEWAEAFPTDLAGARFKTVGGFVVSLLQQVPHVGQTVDYRNVTFTVEAVRRRRVALLRVRLREAQA